MTDADTRPTPMTRAQVRAGRALLACKQERLAHLAGIGITTLRRYEGGQEVGIAIIERIHQALAEAGIVFLPPRTAIGGAPLEAGVGLRAARTNSAALDDPAQLTSAGGAETRRPLTRSKRIGSCGPDARAPLSRAPRVSSARLPRHRTAPDQSAASLDCARTVSDASAMPARAVNRTGNPLFRLRKARLRAGLRLSPAARRAVRRHRARPPRTAPAP